MQGNDESKRLSRLKEALRPFADFYAKNKYGFCRGPDWEISHAHLDDFPLEGWFIEAAAALAEYDPSYVFPKERDMFLELGGVYEE